MYDIDDCSENGFDTAADNDVCNELDFEEVTETDTASVFNELEDVETLDEGETQEFAGDLTEQYENVELDKFDDLEELDDTENQNGNDISKFNFEETLMDEDLFSDNLEGDYTYEQDEIGKHAYGSLELSEDCERNGRNQRMVGGEFRKSDDDGGHLIANRFGGSSELENLEPQNRNLNRGAYKQMENEMAEALEQGDKVYFDAQSYGKAGVDRPDAFMGTYIREDAAGNRHWDTFSFTNASKLEQQEWEQTLEEFDENDE